MRREIDLRRDPRPRLLRPVEIKAGISVDRSATAVRRRDGATGQLEPDGRSSLFIVISHRHRHRHCHRHRHRHRHRQRGRRHRRR